MSVAGMLNQTCTIRSASHADGEGQGTTVSFSDTAGVPCAVQVVNASQSLGELREMGEQVYRVFFSYGQSIKVGDRITWGSRVLDVRTNPVDPSGRGAYSRVDCVERSST